MEKPDNPWLHTLHPLLDENGVQVGTVARLRPKFITRIVSTDYKRKTPTPDDGGRNVTD
jgi:hypothetical protein